MISPPFPRAILFDLDDTILDDRGGLDDVRRTISEDAAKHTPGLLASEFLASMVQVQAWFWSDPERHRVGRRDLRATTTMLLAEALSRVGVVDPGLAAVLGQRYRDLREASNRPIPGAVETVASLAKSGVRLALITNGAGASQRAKIVRHDLARYFDHILIEGEFGVGKPDSTVYLTAMTALGSAPSSTWVVGDNLEWEVAAPQRLGFTGIWVDAAREGLPIGSLVKPDRIIHSVSELVEQA